MTRRNFAGFEPDVIEFFKNYQWPGNIRELSNSIERAVLLEEADTIRMENVSLSGMAGRREFAARPLKNLEASENDLLVQALELSNWVQKDAASRLGVTARKLNYMIHKHGITHAKWRKNK